MYQVQSETNPMQSRDCLMLSLSNPRTGLRIRTWLAGRGIEASESELGLEIWAQQERWGALLEQIGHELSEFELADARVAMAPASEDQQELHRAIFRAQPLETALAHLGEAWFSQLIEKQRLAVHFQPLIQFPPGRVHGYECLLRGIDADGQLIPPVRLFETANRLGRMGELDQHCRLAAIRAASAVATGNLSFFINIMPSAILDPKRCLGEVMEVVESGALRPQQVTFEVVETDRCHDRKHLLNVLRYFRKAGFKVALDDMGAGYSSLLNLSYLRPDYIKLDGELVRRAADGPLEAKIVSDLAEAARQHGIITIAEGIETEHQYRAVLASGIRITQGYLHARPGPKLMDAAQLEAVVGRITGVAAAPAV